MASETSPQPILLIVEDDPIARAGLTTILEREGYRIVTATDGEEALQQLQAGLVPDLVLLDMILPVHDGWLFCHRKRRDTSIARIPVAIMTGLQIACEEWACSLGEIALLHKPIEIETLLEIVRRFSPPSSPANRLAETLALRRMRDTFAETLHSRFFPLARKGIFLHEIARWEART